jgi:hypothetical protein
MRTRTAVIVIALLGFGVVVATATATAGNAPQSPEVEGIVYRYYASSGLRFQPLLSFGKLNAFVSAQDAPAARRLASALLARGVHRGDAVYWPYDFPYGGSPPGWTSGFTQAVAAQALARAGLLVGDRGYLAAAEAAFRGLRRTLLIPLGGGSWIREYSFTDQAILNAQLESLLAIEWYARIARTPAAKTVAADLYVAARTLLPRFDLGCWGRYQLGGARATLQYQTYHVDLLCRLAAKHPEPIWRSTYLRWSRCLQ